MLNASPRPPLCPFECYIGVASARQVGQVPWRPTHLSQHSEHSWKCLQGISTTWRSRSMHTMHLSCSGGFFRVTRCRFCGFCCGFCCGFVGTTIFILDASVPAQTTTIAIMTAHTASLDHSMSLEHVGHTTAEQTQSGIGTTSEAEGRSPSACTWFARARRRRLCRKSRLLGEQDSRVYDGAACCQYRKGQPECRVESHHREYYAQKRAHFDFGREGSAAVLIGQGELVPEKIECGSLRGSVSQCPSSARSRRTTTDGCS